MTLFLVLSALLTLAVLAGLLRPLWRGARGVALGIGIVVLASTALLYPLIGTPLALEAGSLKTPETLGDAVAQLEAELQRDPRQPEGWRLLAQAYQRQDQASKARDAYAKAVELGPEDAGLLAEAAQSRAAASANRLFDAEAVAMLQRALQLEPDHQRARWFLGIAQRQAGDDAAAAATWEPLLAKVDSATAASLRKEIDNARAAAGMAPLPAAVAAANALRVKVSLDPGFASRVRLRGDASVFVIARKPGGPPMPVAVEKRVLSELPFTTTLDDGDSPMPTSKLSDLREVELVVRLSESGEGNRQDGDIESKPVRVVLPTDNLIELMIGSGD